MTLHRDEPRLRTSRIPREIRGEGLPGSIRFLQDQQVEKPGQDVLCESPVFLLSAGWRSGSTLLQRLICSDGATLMWGEPFGDRVPICRLASTVEGFCSTDGHLKYGIQEFQGDLPGSWIANLNPGLDSLHSAHLAFFEALFAQPAAARGFPRWGVKWVRLSGYHASYLRWLYPKAKIVFLVRHPLNAYRSYRGKRWFTVKPRHPVRGLLGFLAHWRYVASSFLSEWRTSRATVIRYEDILRDPKFLEQLSAALGIQMDARILDRKLGARSESQKRVSWRERIVSHLMTASVCDSFGYAAGTPVRRSQALMEFPSRASDAADDKPGRESELLQAGS